MILNKYIFLIVILLVSNIYAKKIRGEYSTKNILAQEIYLDKCSSCHGDARRGGTMASIIEWKDIFSNDAKLLVDLHENDTQTIDILKYFKGQTFKKDKILILKLLQEFAYDSEFIPTCN